MGRTDHTSYTVITTKPRIADPFGERLIRGKGSQPDSPWFNEFATVALTLDVERVLSNSLLTSVPRFREL